MPLRHRFLSISVRKYKAFDPPARLEIAPLTILFGRNGSGKSALVRLPLLLAEALQGRGAPGLPLSTHSIKHADSLLDFVHGRRREAFSLSVGLGRGDQEEWTLDAQVGPDAVSRGNSPGQVLESYTISSTDHGVLFSNDRFDGAFSGLVPVGADGGPIPEAACLRPPPKVSHLGPARPPPVHPVDPEQPGLLFDVGIDGSDTGRVLGSHTLYGRREMVDQVVDRTRRILGVELRVSEIREGGVSGTTIQCRSEGRDTWVTLAEMGTGLIHALPFITQQCVAVSGRPEDDLPTLLVCEEPEAHLHPRAQADIADVALEAALSGRSLVLVETHSETFLLRVRRRIAEGRILADQVSFYLVDDEGTRTTLRRLQAQPDGSVEGWPEGWFDAALEEVRGLIRAGAPR